MAAIEEPYFNLDYWDTGILIGDHSQLVSLMAAGSPGHDYHCAPYSGVTCLAFNYTGPICFTVKESVSGNLASGSAKFWHKSKNNYSNYGGVFLRCQNPSSYEPVDTYHIRWARNSLTLAYYDNGGTWNSLDANSGLSPSLTYNNWYRHRFDWGSGASGFEVNCYVEVAGEWQLWTTVYDATDRWASSSTNLFGLGGTASSTNYQGYDELWLYGVYE